MTTTARPFETYKTIKHVSVTNRLGQTRDFNTLVEVNFYMGAGSVPVMIEKSIANDRTAEGKAILDAYREEQKPRTTPRTEKSAPRTGDKVEVTGTIIYHEADTHRNTTDHFAILLDDAGNSWKLTTAAQFGAHVNGFRDQLGWIKGNTMTLKATVKAVGEYKGAPSYTITRPKLTAFALGPWALEERSRIIAERDSRPCLAHKVAELAAEYATTDDRNDVHVKLNKYEEHERFNCPTHRAKTFEYPTAG